MNALVLPCLLIVALPFLSGCVSGRDKSASPSSGRLHHLGGHRFKVTTRSTEAQRNFDRGLTLAYAFSHRAAEEEFRRAAEADPDCVMAWWGVALVNGPHINFPTVTPDHARAAWEALGYARALAPRGDDRERALIGALELRYADPQPEDRAALDTAYAAAMREVWLRYPNDADVGTLFAEALMDLHPWDLWQSSGAPQPWTPEILATLEQALKINPKHPGATHLYIHAVEASPHPERALAAANQLRRLVPGASHLVHMPAHIYVRTGQWEEAAQANKRAMAADTVYRATFPQPGFYTMYMVHNTHFLAYTAMMRGQGTEAIRLAREMVASVPEEFLEHYAPVADGFMIFVSEVLMRFGRWEEILAEPRPRPGLPLSLALWHFSRGVAFTALNRPGEAEQEQAALRSAIALVPKEWTFGNNSATTLLAIASHVLDGEMAAKAGRYDESIARLRAAVEIEDSLRYDEPPDWIQPVRHTLGAVLLRDGRAAEAEEVYRADLARYPRNGWSLFGLSRALALQGEKSEAAQVEREFQEAWVVADLKLGSSCLCQPGS